MAPRKLTRKALPYCFSKVSPSSWDYFLDGVKTEKKIGLFECRTGEHSPIYYDIEKVKRWLIERGHYAPDDFLSAPEAGKWSGLQVRRHWA